MDAEMAAIYRDTLLSHGRQPQQFAVMEHPDLQSVGDNPLWGDRLAFYFSINVHENTVADCTFYGKACLICTASASMMSTRLCATTKAQALRLIQAFVHWIQEGGPQEDSDLAAFDGVRPYPSRRKCATLPWLCAQHALTNGNGTVSNE